MHGGGTEGGGGGGAANKRRVAKQSAPPPRPSAAAPPADAAAAGGAGARWAPARRERRADSRRTSRERAAKVGAGGRVVVMGKTNARNLPTDSFPESPDLATVDISFISLEKVLPSVFNVLTSKGEAVVLVKPQFEVGKGQVGKGGVVRDRPHPPIVV